jgi:ADP-ribose pyrophosphatase
MRTIIPKDARLVPEDASLVFKGQIFEVYQWPQKMYDGTTATFEMLKRPDTLKVIAIKDDKIIILDQKQPDSERSFLDLPGGRHDYEQEDELAAAKRETLEETGMVFKNWRLIKVEQPHSKIDWFVYLFLATGFESQQEQDLDNGERIDVQLLSLEEAKKLLGSPSARHLPKDLLESCDNINDLTGLPEYVN